MTWKDDVLELFDGKVTLRLHYNGETQCKIIARQGARIRSNNLESARGPALVGSGFVREFMKIKGSFKSPLLKRAKKGFRGYPVGTIAFYGPTAQHDSKLNP
jgi:hypothetical protein